MDGEELVAPVGVEGGAHLGEALERRLEMTRGLNLRSRVLCKFEVGEPLLVRHLQDGEATAVRRRCDGGVTAFDGGVNRGARPPSSYGSAGLCTPRGRRAWRLTWSVFAEARAWRRTLGPVFAEKEGSQPRLVLEMKR